MTEECSFGFGLSEYIVSLVGGEIGVEVDAEADDGLSLVSSIFVNVMTGREVEIGGDDDMNRNLVLEPGVVNPRRCLKKSILPRLLPIVIVQISLSIGYFMISTTF
ncbi:hypothetical protein FRB91_007384 [Serendipita sp. 411]|nr:hypothetical protein FRB91_007384 [Serendipita sp. 411]